MEPDPSHEPSASGAELPTEQDMLDLVEKVRQKLGANGSELISEQFKVKLENFDRLLLASYPEGARLESGEGLCVAVYYDSALGRWPQSGGSIYEVVRADNNLLQLNYFDRSPITQTTPIEVDESIKDQREQT